MVFVLYLIGILIAVLTGLLLRNSLLQGESVPFVMELPAYHVPTLRGILTHTWERLKGFLIRAGRVILVVVMVLSFLNSIGTDGSFGNQDSEDSILSHICISITSVFSPMGIGEENGLQPLVSSSGSLPKKPWSAPSIRFIPSWMQMI